MGESAGFSQSRPCEAVMVLVALLEVVRWWEKMQGFRRADPVRLLWCWSLCWKLSVGGESAGFSQSRPCETVMVLVAVLEVVRWWEKVQGFRRADPVRLLWCWSLCWKLSVGGRKCRVYAEQTLQGCCSVDRFVGSCSLVEGFRRADPVRL